MRLKVINHLNVKAEKWELGYVQSQLPDCTQSTTSGPSNQNQMIQMRMIVCNHNRIEPKLKETVN